MTFRFVHIADVHLDAPYASRDAGLRALLRESSRRALAAAVELAVEEKVHSLLVAGDLFDNTTLSLATEKFLLAQLCRLQEAGISVYYAPGNHDPYGGGAGKRIQWPANVHVFASRHPETVIVYDRSGRAVGEVTGAGHEGPAETANLASTFPPASETLPRAGLLHCLVAGVHGEARHGRYAPCTLADLLGKGYAYWALGHVHAPAVLTGDPPVVYPGSLMGKNPGEEGPRGAYLVEIAERGGTHTTFRPLAPVCWLTFRVTGLEKAGNVDLLAQRIENAVQERLEQVGRPEKLLARVVLEGPCPLWRELQSEEDRAALAESLQATLRAEYLELAADRVVRPVHPAAYRGEPHLLGAVLDLIDRLQEDGELLARLAPPELAGNAAGGDVLSYLRSLLPGLDAEAVARLLEAEGQ